MHDPAYVVCSQWVVFRKFGFQPADQPAFVVSRLGQPAFAQTNSRWFVFEISMAARDGRGTHCVQTQPSLLVDRASKTSLLFSGHLGVTAQGPRSP